MSLWRDCLDALEQFCRENGCKELTDTPVSECSTNNIIKAVVPEESDANHFKNLNLLRNAHVLRAYYDFITFFADEVVEKLTIKSNTPFTMLAA